MVHGLHQWEISWNYDNNKEATSSATNMEDPKSLHCHIQMFKSTWKKPNDRISPLKLYKIKSILSISDEREWSFLFLSMFVILEILTYIIIRKARRIVYTSSFNHPHREAHPPTTHSLSEFHPDREWVRITLGDPVYPDAVDDCGWDYVATNEVDDEDVGKENGWEWWG